MILWTRRISLDILGNENRRNILNLLSYRPCYVTEISEELKVSPKAIIDHLKILEEAGLVESFHDQQGRKYFQIANNVSIRGVHFAHRLPDRGQPGGDWLGRAENAPGPVPRRPDQRRHGGPAEVPLRGGAEAHTDEPRAAGDAAIDPEHAVRGHRHVLSRSSTRSPPTRSRRRSSICSSAAPSASRRSPRRLNIPGPVARTELARLMKKGLVTYRTGQWSIA